MTWIRCWPGVADAWSCGSPDRRPTSARSRESRELVVDGDRITCSLEGDPKPFLAAIARAPVADIVIEAARLEEAFLELYAGPESVAPEAAT